MKKIFKFILGMPLGLKLSFIMILVSSVSIIIISNILFNKEKALFLKEIKNRGEILSENLAAAGMEVIVNKDKLFSSDTIGKIMKGEGILYAVIADKNDKVVDSSFSEDKKAFEIQKKYKEKLETDTEQIIKDGFLSLDYEGKKVINVFRPIIVEYKNKSNKLGLVHIGMSQDIIDNEIRNARNSIIKVAVILILAGILISFIFASTITIPVRKIVRVMQAVVEGDLSKNVIISLTDEIGKLADSFNVMIVHLREKLLMSKYVSKSTIQMISDSSDKKAKTNKMGVRKKATMLFSDIRGFTAFSEKRTPEQIISMLNKYLSIQADIIHSYDGSVDKFVGDEVVAVFEGEKAPENAVKSAIDILKKITELNKTSANKISVGIGINTGEVVMGNMGSNDRKDYTVIGDNVNAAARLCSAAKEQQIIVSKSSYQLIENKFKFSKPSQILVKGKKEPIEIYAVLY